MKKILLASILFISCAHLNENSKNTQNTTNWSSPISEHCFINNFSSDLFPWKLDECLNYEEVFKNYEFFETLVQKDMQILIVKRYKQGNIVEILKYKIQTNQKLKALSP